MKRTFSTLCLLLALTVSIFNTTANAAAHDIDSCKTAVTAEIFHEISPSLYVDTKLQRRQRAPLYITVVNQDGLPGGPGQLIHCTDCSALKPREPVLICRSEKHSVNQIRDTGPSIVVQGFIAKPIRLPSE